MKLSISEISRLLPIARRRIGEKLTRWVQKMFSNEKLKKDIFKTGREQKALLCYLPEAFNGKELPKYHSNFTECHTAAEALHRLGYSVDCASRGKSGIDYSRYDVVFGINCPSYAASFTVDGKTRPLRIFYSVGAHTFYNFRITAARNKEFFARHNSWLMTSCHYVPGNGMNYYMSQLSDAVISLGDSFLVQQMESEGDDTTKVKALPAFYFKVCTPDEKKDFSKCRNKILWFGSSGMLHKGLDIAIDFALEHPQFTLHICGGSRQEKDFWKLYMPNIKKAGNIVMHGFVDIESEEFASILAECGILLNPSLSESGAVAVLNVLGNGALLPVYSKGTGLDIADAGIEVEEVCYENFKNALLAVAELPAETIEKKAWAAHRRVKEKYTLENYSEAMYNHLKEIIKK
ncbi:MAG: glycosyltransferase [Bacteroidaceae bacterium]|nr:glycosyltransferase [Bacteroidaceae bacterium]